MGAPDHTADVHAEIESEGRFVTQIAAMLSAAEVALSGPEKVFEKADHLRVRRVARRMLKEARRQARHDRDFVPFYDLDYLPADP